MGDFSYIFEDYQDTATLGRDFAVLYLSDL